MHHGRNTLMGICFSRKKIQKTINKNINSRITSDTFHFWLYTWLTCIVSGFQGQSSAKAAIFEGKMKVSKSFVAKFSSFSNSLADYREMNIQFQVQLTVQFGSALEKKLIKALLIQLRAIHTKWTSEVTCFPDIKDCRSIPETCKSFHTETVISVSPLEVSCTCPGFLQIWE